MSTRVICRARRATALFTASWVCGWAQVGVAAPAPHVADALRLHWTAPAECPSEAQVFSRIEQLLAGSNVMTSSRLLVTARTQQLADASYEASLTYEVDGLRNTRVLHAVTCDALAAATALIVATAIDPAAAARADAADSPRPTPPAAPALPVRPAAAPTPDSERGKPAFSPKRQPVALLLANSAWGGVNMLPGLAWGFGGSVGARRGAWSVFADGQYWPEQRRRSDARATAGADFSRYTVGLRSCFGWQSARWVLDLCGGAELLAVHGAGYGVTVPKQATELWVAPFGGPSLGLQLRPQFFLVGRVELSFPVARHDFVLEGVGFVYRLPPVGARLGLGVAVAF